MKLGIDIGRVIIAPDPQGTRGDTSFIGGSIQDALNTPPFDGMFDVVPGLVELFKGQVWLVSKARPRVQEKTRLWLQHHRFFERTGIPAENLRFCLERPEKTDHCRELEISHFIDDRLDVLECLEGVVVNRFLFGPQKHPTAPDGIILLPSWDAAAKCVGNTVNA